MSIDAAEYDGRRPSTSQHRGTDSTHSRQDAHSPLNDRASTGYLDGLRGLAAVIVFIQHWDSAFTLGLHELGFGQEGHYHFASVPFINILYHGGDAAVVIFFVISGYVLSIGHLQKLKQQKPTQWSLLSAVLRRPFRLYAPCLAVTLIQVFLLHIPGLVLPIGGLNLQDNLFAEIRVFVERSVSYFNPWQVHDSNLWWYPYNVVMWTIPVELKGSMLVFVILGLYSLIAPGPRRGRALIPTALLFVIGSVMIQLAIKWSMANFIFGFVLAVNDVWKLDARLLQNISPAARSFALHIVFFLGWYLLAMPHRVEHLEYTTMTPGYAWIGALTSRSYDPSIYYRYWQSWGALLLVYGIDRLDNIQRYLSTRPMKFLGKVSFALYLCHLLLLRILGDRVTALFGADVSEALKGTFWDGTFSMPDAGLVGLSTRFIVCAVIVLPANLLVAKHLTAWIDDPIVALAKKMTARLSNGKGNVRNAVEGEPMLPMVITRRNSL